VRLRPITVALAALASFTIASACGGPRHDAASTSAVKVPDPDDVRPTATLAETTLQAPLPPELPGCSHKPVARDSLELRSAVLLGQAAGRTWVLALPPLGPDGEDAAALLLHLDSAAGLVQTPVPWLEHVAIEHGPELKLRFVDASAGSWRTVDLADPRRPKVGPARPIPGLVVGEHPKAVASDGARALVSLYRKAPAGSAERYIGETFFLNAESGARIGKPAPMTVWAAQCADGRCFGYATINRDPQPNVFVAIDDAGAREIGEHEQPECGGLVDWRDEDEWRIAYNLVGQVGLTGINLKTGALRRSSIPFGAATCTDVKHIETSTGHGLIITAGSGTAAGTTTGEPRFVTIDAELRAGPPQRLPAPVHREQIYVAAGTSVLTADFESASWRQHDPPGPDGSYEYNEYWSFKGQLGLLSPGDPQWRVEQRTPLLHDGEDGTMGDGFRPILMSAPGTAGVLLVSDTMEPSVYISVVDPCRDPGLAEPTPDRRRNGR